MPFPVDLYHGPASQKRINADRLSHPRPHENPPDSIGAEHALVNPAKHPHVKKELGQQFIDWLISGEGQKAIADYKVDGEQVFWPQRE